MSEDKEKQLDYQQQCKVVANIYAQPQPGFASSIIATTKALKTLIRALNDAIDTGEGIGTLCTSDMVPYEIIVIRNDEPIRNLYWKKLRMPYTEYEVQEESSCTYGPTEYFDYGIRSTEDLENEITSGESKYLRISKEEVMRITQGCAEQNKKYGFPKAGKPREYDSDE